MRVLSIILRCFWDPFRFLRGAAALVVGLLLIALAAWLGAQCQAHLDGVLDTHYGPERPIWFFLMTGISNWLCMSAALGLMCWLYVKGDRINWLNLIGAQALARMPFVLVTWAFGNAEFKAAMRALEQLDYESLQDPLKVLPMVTMVDFWLVSLISFFALLWFIWLSWRGFSTACNRRGKSAVFGFIGALILAELLSKWAFAALNKLAL